MPLLLSKVVVSSANLLSWVSSYTCSSFGIMCKVLFSHNTLDPGLILDLRFGFLIPLGDLLSGET